MIANAMRPKEYVDGSYEPETNILRLRWLKPVVLDTPKMVDAVFQEVIENWVKPADYNPYVLIDYANMQIAPEMGEHYGKYVAFIKNHCLAIIRYNVPSATTRVAISGGNIKAGKSSNMFATEKEAREAVAEMRAARAQK
jgi:hypothetical protein